MQSIEKAFLIDICLGIPLGKIWLPSNLPDVSPKDIPDTYLLKGKQLAAFKKLFIAEDALAVRTVEGVCKQADTYLNMLNPSVVYKTKVPEGATRNDYCSLAKYWWPNPETEDGKPYILFDGEVNPEYTNDIYDFIRFEEFTENTLSLSIASYLSSDSKYAEKAVRMVKTWLLDSATRQTPHFQFAQRVPGVEKPRFQGIIEARRLIYVCEALKLLEHLGAIDKSDLAECKTWFEQLLQWFQISEQGLKAWDAKNNIGFWFDMQRIIYARFVGQERLVESIIKDSVLSRIDLQMDDEGKLIHELSRTNPYDYVAFTLLALAEMDTASQSGAINLAKFSSEEGKNFQNAFNWFNETIQSNSLHEPAFALNQYLDSQLHIEQLEEENRILKKTLQGKTDNKDKQSQAEEHFLQPKKIGSINPEVSRLHFELNDVCRSIMIIAMHYRGTELIVEEQTKELGKREQEINRLKRENTDLNNKYKKVTNSRVWRYSITMRKVANNLKGKNLANKFKDAIRERQAKQHEINPVDLLRSVKPKNLEALKKEYTKKGLDQVPDTFVLYRIIGNDLYPRHRKGQSRENLKFILENEPAFENCEKVFILNRIIDQDEEKAIIDLLEKHNQEYLRILFVAEEYKKIGFDIDCLPKPGYFASQDYSDLGPEQKARVIGAVYRLKNNYVMNNNGARNYALQDGKKRGKWVLPWDGNCFISQSAWDHIWHDVKSAPYLKYFAVPMARVTDNNQLLSTGFVPDPVEEPQLIFRKDSTEIFNEDFCYGRRPKVELFWRLGIPGKWDRWKDDSWDQKRRSLAKDAKQFGVAGWVARMHSGMSKLEQDNKNSFKQRGIARLESIIITLRNADIKVANIKPGDLTNFSSGMLQNECNQYLDQNDNLLITIIDNLIEDAEEALKRGPYSVIDKKSLPPSGNVNDYYHPAPYWWPNPKTADGLPYIQRDGERVPGTNLYEPESENYDRTRLQRVFDDSIILALAWKFTGDIKYAQHGEKILKNFFVDPVTQMNPHLKYSQVILGKNNNQGSSSGIIEMKDLYYYLDAVRIFDSAKVNNLKIINDFKDWLACYMEWVLKSPQGKKECSSINNHGTYYDLQVASIAAYLNEKSVLFETLCRAQSRIAQQFLQDGSQPEELRRTITAHYCCFNFQGWINLATLASCWGVDLWSYEASNGSSLKRGARWLLSHMGGKWPYKQINEFDLERFLPIWHSVPADVIDSLNTSINPNSNYEIKTKFYPHDGIRPYWNLGLGCKSTIK